MSSTLDPARRAALVGAKLVGLVADAGRGVQGDAVALGSGAAVVDDVGEAWALIDEPLGRGLGGALAWAVRRECNGLRIVAEAGTGAMVRRSVYLSLPVTVVYLDGRTMVAALADPLPAAAAASAHHRALAELIVAGGATVVEEHGVVSGEVRGLEVCRVVDEPGTGSARLEVGIGASDREMYQMVHGARSPVESLIEVVRSVELHRQPHAQRHPLNLLGASRLLRSRLIDDAAAVGLSTLVAAEPPIARANLKDEVPCVAFDHTTNTAVVCVSGVDLEVVPFACDVIARYSPSSCLIAAPARDILPIQQRLAELVTIPTRFVPVENRPSGPSGPASGGSSGAA
jgi:hypothetical protein